MRQHKSILLLFIMGMAIFPLQSICINHTFGHEHQEPSPCEIHSMAAQQPGGHILPTIECERISDTIDDYSRARAEQIVPTAKIAEKSFLLPPEPNAHSATLLSDSPLRAPPWI